jgi:hypothetical protein
MSYKYNLKGKLGFMDTFRGVGGKFSMRGPTNIYI